VDQVYAPEKLIKIFVFFVCFVDQVYAPEKLIKIDGGSLMRRKIEFFTGKKQTSFYFLDSFFSWLPPPSATRGDSFCKNRPREASGPVKHPQKLLIKSCFSHYPCIQAPMHPCIIKEFSCQTYSKKCVGCPVN
jgi:hypothetical protein